MRLLRLIFSALLVLGLTLPMTSQGLPASGPESLVRIEKGTPGLEGILKSESMTIVQELKGCYVGFLDREDILSLRRRGISVSILDRDSTAKEYFLVRPGPEATAADLARKGRVAALDPDVLLFWTASGDGSALLAPALPRKPLPLSSITPFLRTVRTQAREVKARAWDATIASLAGEVSEENLEALIAALQDFRTRLTGTPGNEAAAVFIEDYFRRQGLTAFSERGVAGASPVSVIGELTGRTYPEDEVVVCAHFDSISSDPYNDAPGADDDAGGVAAVMEAARILAGHPTEFTIRFVAFSGEEQGLLGSAAYAHFAATRERRVIGVVNLDMIAYADGTPEDLDVAVNEASDWLGERFRTDSAAYGGPPVRKIVDPSAIYSDHASFWNSGYPALLGIEDLPPNNPHYHTTGDTGETLDFDFCARVTRAALATAAGLGQIVEAGEPQPPSNLTGIGSFFSSFFGRRKNAYLSWPAVTGAAGYNVYRTDTSHLNYEKVNNRLVEENVFSDRGIPSGVYHYYVVTAVDGAGLESNPSREIEIQPYPRESP